MTVDKCGFVDGPRDIKAVLAVVDDLYQRDEKATRRVSRGAILDALVEVTKLRHLVCNLYAALPSCGYCTSRAASFSRSDRLGEYFACSDCILDLRERDAFVPLSWAHMINETEFFMKCWSGFSATDPIAVLQTECPGQEKTCVY